jgi:hypothetical protein
MSKKFFASSFFRPVDSSDSKIPPIPSSPPKNTKACLNPGFNFKISGSSPRSQLYPILRSYPCSKGLSSKTA